MKQRGAYKKSEASRKQVLDAAIRELAERGYAHTSVSDIAAAAKMSKGAVHYHFESKDELLERVLDACCERIERRITTVFDEPGAPLDRVRRALLDLQRRTLALVRDRVDSGLAPGLDQVRAEAAALRELLKSGAPLEALRDAYSRLESATFELAEAMYGASS